MNSALRLVDWKGSGVAAPATILPQALDYLSGMHVREFRRLEATIDFSRANRQGAVRVNRAEEHLAKHIAAKFEGQDQAAVSFRAVVVVALYAYALHILAQSQMTLFRRMVAYLRRELATPTARARVQQVTQLTDAGLDQFLNTAGQPAAAMQSDASETFIRFSQMVEALGGAPTPTVFHAAAVAATDDDFFDMVGNRGVIVPLR